jgi:hypothetical protein
MGYDLHITRKEDWADPDGPEITADEWLGIVRSDDELQLDEANGKYFAIWAVRPGDDGGWIDWSHGELYSKAPDAALIRKMEQIAAHLNARVVGDDGEEYRDGKAVAQPRKRGLTWTRLVLLYLAYFILMCLLGIGAFWMFGR